MTLSALNNTAIDESMSIDDILAEADKRLVKMNRDSVTSTGQKDGGLQSQWNTLLNTARETLPSAVRPYLRVDRTVDAGNTPNKVSVFIDLPNAERIFYGPFVFDAATNSYSLGESWKNKPFEIRGTYEEFGDLLEAIGRAREVYRNSYEV